MTLAMVFSDLWICQRPSRRRVSFGENTEVIILVILVIFWRDINFMVCEWNVDGLLVLDLINNQFFVFCFF